MRNIKSHCTPNTLLSKYGCFSFLAVLSLIGAQRVVAITSAIEEHVPSPELVGKGRMSFYVWDVYDAELFAPRGDWNEDKPFALSLSYLRHIEGRKIADRSVQEIRKLGYSNEVKLATWHSQMREIFPNVEKGTKLTGIKTGKEHTLFYHNHEFVGKIDDEEFSRYFFRIWLSTKTGASELRKQLLGKQ